jgi:hypothetical protein
LRTPRSGVVYDQQRYFQQVRPLSECDADDGRVVGHMLMDLVEEKPKDPAHAIQTFVNRTAMLRECGFRHIGAMLVRLLNTDSQGGPDDATAIVVLSPSVATEEQASALGSAIASSACRSHATALKQVVQSHTVLRAMKSGYGWFVPMLEVIATRKAAALRRSSMVKRFSSIVTAKAASAVPNDETLDADRADEESSFSSVVRLCPRSIRTALLTLSTCLDVALMCKACVWLRTFQGVMRHTTTAGACGSPR